MILFRAWLLWEQFQKKSELFQENVLLVPHGDDFRYSDPREWEKQFRNLEKLMAYINSNAEMNTKVMQSFLFICSLWKSIIAALKFIVNYLCQISNRNSCYCTMIYVISCNFLLFLWFAKSKSYTVTLYNSTNCRVSF